MEALARQRAAEETQRSREAHRKRLNLTPEEYDAAELEVVTENPGIGPLKKMVAMNKKGKTAKAEGNGGKRRRTRKRKAKRTRRSRHRR